LHELGALELLDGMAVCDVGDLVAEDPGKLGLVLQFIEEAARNVDEPAGEGEGVHFVVVEHAELPGEVGAGRVGGEVHADFLDVLLDRGVGVEAAELTLELRGGLTAHGDFLLFTDGAAGEEEDEKEG
jgi:hypothetical protein